MALKHQVLTDQQIRQAKPREKNYNLYDVGGLYLTVSASGGKWWRLKYRFADKERRAGLGSYPDVSLAVARHKRDVARLTLREGKDPISLKRAEAAHVKVSANSTFEKVAREWLEVKAPSWVASQLKKERRRLELHAFPWIGKTPIADVKAGDLKPLLSRVVASGTVDTAHRLRQQISAIFNFAARDERVANDPARFLAGVLPEHTQRRYSNLTDPDEVGALLRALDTFKGQFSTACALQLAPLLFVRPGELRAAEWNEFDLDSAEWRIPPARRKLKKRLKEDKAAPPHIVPLATQAVAILRELRPLTGHRTHVFPGARDPKRPMSNVTLNAALRRLGYDRDTMTAHGFRHMASTMLNEQGWNPDAIERQLSHKGQGIRAVYNQAELLPQRRAMMQAWADYLDGLRIAVKAPA